VSDYKAEHANKHAYCARWFWNWINFVSL